MIYRFVLIFILTSFQNKCLESKNHKTEKHKSIKIIKWIFPSYSYAKYFLAIPMQNMIENSNQSYLIIYFKS